MSSASIVLDLVGRIYDAASEPKLWPVFLDKFADAVRGTTTSLILYDLERGNGNLAATVRIDPDHQRKYDEYYAGVDAFAYGKHLFDTGKVLSGQMLCPDGILERSEFYNDFLRKFDAFHQFCGVIFKEGSALSVIASLRPKRVGPFGKSETGLLEALMPHLQRSIQLHRRLVGSEIKTGLTAEILDRMPMGVLVIGTDGKVLMLNRRARAIMDQNDGLCIGREGLCARRSDETKRLQELIQGAKTAGSGKGLYSGGAMTISRPSLNRPFEVMVTPLRSSGLLLGQPHPVAAVFISDPERQTERQDQILSRLYSLTPAEARLAATLMQGNSLSDAAEQLGVTRNTVHSQLQKIFDKTATSRQGELVRLLWNSPARLAA